MSIILLFFYIVYEAWQLTRDELVISQTTAHLDTLTGKRWNWGHDAGVTIATRSYFIFCVPTFIEKLVVRQ